MIKFKKKSELQMKQGVIFNIQKFSIHDGPGIRTTVFFKGCPLKCEWCANPESQKFNVQILWDDRRCDKNLKCVDICEEDAIHEINGQIVINQNKCTNCFKCVEACPTQALNITGDTKEVQEIVDICLQDKDFYEESGGGVTISGGEGMAQPEFLKELVHELKKENLHLTIETTGYTETETFKELAPLFDLVLFDVKHHSSSVHFKYTHVNNELILDNLEWAIQNEINVLVRIPVIPKVNDDIYDALEFSKLFNKIGIQKVQLLPFHQFGEKKYEMLNQEYLFKDTKALHQEDLVDYQKIFLDHNIDCFF